MSDNLDVAVKADNSDNRHYSFYAGYAAIFIVAVLIISKTYAYYQSGSVSILSSLIDSIMDSLVSIMALASIYYASKPADEDHRFGHAKMEAVSALFQAAIIAGGGAFIVFEAVNNLVSPVAVSNHVLGIYVMLLSIILSVLLVSIQRFSLKKSDSIAVEADSAHYGSDIVINAGTLVVLGLGVYGVPLWIDPLFAVLVALFMGYLARGIAVKSLDILLDRELPDEDRQRIITIIEAHPKVLGWHDLRTRLNGSCYVISFDIEADPTLSLYDAHEIAKNLEDDIALIYPCAEVFIHIDPEGYQEQCSRHRVKGVHI